MIKLKIVLIGPTKAGKSTIANFLSEAIDYTNTEYRPTPGVRILEFELNTKEFSSEIELWDCSGDLKYDSYWPVFLWNAHGVILVYNPEDKDQLPELQRFHENFVTNSAIPKNNAMILAHSKDPDYTSSSHDFSGEIANILHENSNVLEDSDKLKSIFEKYIGSILSNVTNFERDDLSLITMPM